jgi:hypothetical protein
MRPGLKLLLLILLLVVARAVQAVPLAELRDNYQPIIDRNPFGLHPPPPPPTNNPTANQEKKPKTELLLTGITSVGHPIVPKQAYFMTKETEKNNKSSTNYYALREGVEKDGIKVLSIDEVGRKVRVHTEDGEQILSFETHGIAPPAAPGPKPGAPGAPGMPGGQPVANQPGAFPVPQPTVQPQPIYNTGAAATTGNNAVRQIPSRRVRAGADGGVSPAVPGGPLPGGNPSAGGAQPQELDPAEQYLRMHLNRAAAEKQGIPQPPLPIIGQ